MEDKNDFNLSSYWEQDSCMSEYSLLLLVIDFINENGLGHKLNNYLQECKEKEYKENI